MGLVRHIDEFRKQTMIIMANTISMTNPSSVEKLSNAIPIILIIDESELT